MKEKRLVFRGLESPEPLDAPEQISETDKMLLEVSSAYHDEVAEFQVNKERREKYGIELGAQDLKMITDALLGSPVKMERTLKMWESRYNRLHFRKDQYGLYEIPGDVVHFKERYLSGNQKEKREALKSLVIMTLSLKGPSKDKMAKYKAAKGLERKESAKRYHEIVDKPSKRVEIWGEKPKSAQLESDIDRIVEVLADHFSGLDYRGLNLTPDLAEIRQSLLKRVLPEDLKVDGKKFLSPIDKGMSDGQLKKHLAVVLQEYYQKHQRTEEPEKSEKPEPAPKKDMADERFPGMSPEIAKKIAATLDEMQRLGEAMSYDQEIFKSIQYLEARFAAEKMNYRAISESNFSPGVIGQLVIIPGLPEGAETYGPHGPETIVTMQVVGENKAAILLVFENAGEKTAETFALKDYKKAADRAVGFVKAYEKRDRKEVPKTLPEEPEKEVKAVEEPKVNLEALNSELESLNEALSFLVGPLQDAVDRSKGRYRLEVVKSRLDSNKVLPAVLGVYQGDKRILGVEVGIDENSEVVYVHRSLDAGGEVLKAVEASDAEKSREFLTELLALIAFVDLTPALEGLLLAHEKRGAEGLVLQQENDVYKVLQGEKLLFSVKTLEDSGMFEVKVGEKSVEVQGVKSMVERVENLLRVKVNIDPKRREELEARAEMPRPYVKKAVEIGSMREMGDFVEDLFLEMYPKGNEPGIRGRRFFTFDSAASEDAYNMALDVFKENDKYKMEIILFYGSGHEKVFRWEHPRYQLGSLFALEKHQNARARKQFVADFNNWLKDNVAPGGVPEDLAEKGVKREEITFTLDEVQKALGEK